MTGDRATLRHTRWLYVAYAAWGAVCFLIGLTESLEMTLGAFAAGIVVLTAIDNRLETAALGALAMCGGFGGVPALLILLGIVSGGQFGPFAAVLVMMNAAMLAIPAIFVALVCAQLATIAESLMRGYRPTARRLNAPPKRAGYCMNCDYNLRGLTGNRCPECGEPFRRFSSMQTDTLAVDEQIPPKQPVRFLRGREERSASRRARLRLES